MSTTHFFTGSLVKWRRGTSGNEDYGLLLGFERKNTPVIPNIMGAWIQWPDHKSLMWTALTSLEALVQSGSYT